MNSVDRETQRHYLDGIAGLKLIALLLIIVSHYGVKIWTINPLSRCVELLFVTSGFLAIYNFRFNGDNSILKNSIYYIKHRLIPIFPLYYLTFLYFAIVSKPSVKEVILSFFMLQAWSNDPNIYFSLNGPAWFISSLMFCLAFVPLIYSILTKYVTSKKKSIWIPIMIFFIRIIGEYYLSIISTFPTS